MGTTRRIGVSTSQPAELTKWRGCRTFSMCNAALRARGHAEINWSLGAAPGAKPQRDLRQTFGVNRSVRDDEGKTISVEEVSSSGKPDPSAENTPDLKAEPSAKAKPGRGPR